MGKIYLIGAGPGDPELMTLKAVRALGEADVVLYDHLLDKTVLQYCKPGAELIFVGKSKGDHTLPQEQINARLVELLDRYEVVARLKGGDPLLFGRGGEEYEFILRRGIECEIIPGITSAMGSAAYLGLPLTHRDYSSELVIITGHKQRDDDYSRFRAMKLRGKTHVFYMVVSAMPRILEEIMSDPDNRDIPAAVVENATRPGQRMVIGEVHNIAEKARVAGVEPPALLILGEVVRFAAAMEPLRKQLATAGGGS